MLFWKQFFCLIVIFLGSSYGARIMGIASLPTLSHNLFFRPLWKALADRGHQVIVLTTNPMEEPYKNIKEIDFSYVYERKAEVSNLTWTYYNWPKIITVLYNMFKDIAVMELNHPEVQIMLKNETEHFDLVIAEMHIPLMFGFAHRFKCPLIGISSTEIIWHQHALLDVFTPRIEMAFMDRILATYFRIMDIIRLSNQKPILENLLRNYFGPEVPNLDALTRNIHFVFINVHPTFNDRALGPRFVTIGGGMNIEEQKALPKDLQELLDNSVAGVVYFSLGTNVKVQQYPPDFLNRTIEAFREIPYLIIWKFADDFQDLPTNVKVFKWLPQQDLLRHPNIKAFITQCGLHSREESIDAGVPMIGIPFLSDQYKNVRDLVNKGFGISLNKDTFTKDDLKNAVIEVIGNPRYKKAVNAASQLIKDQPMTGLEKAIWHVEYSIRNKEYQVLFPSNHNVPWYQYYFLDVISILFVTLFIFMYILKKLLVCFKNTVLSKLLKIKRD